MVSAQGFTKSGKIYLWLVIAAGLAVASVSIHELYIEHIGRQWFILAALTVISGSATVRLPSAYASISTSETFVITVWISERYDEPHKALFNLSAPAVSLWCSSHLFFYVAGIAPLLNEPSPVAPINAVLPALVLFALTYFCLNSWLITFVIALQRHLNPVTVWKKSFIWLSLNYLGGASVAILLVGYN